jgi:putative restriction endonuclease
MKFMSGQSASGEMERRLAIWRELATSGGSTGISPRVIHDLRIHRGQQGVYRDLTITGDSSVGPAGIAVGLLHSGGSYSDELSDDGVVYHHPSTSRGSRDQREVSSLRACWDLGLPLFVVVASKVDPLLRDVRLGWIRDVDSPSGMTLILFSEGPPPSQGTKDLEDLPFKLRDSRDSRLAMSHIRPNQWRFRFDVLKRYGPVCAACEITDARLLQAAHLCPAGEGGSDDPRNGLPLCPTHHVALDRGFIRIEPTTLSIMGVDSATDLAALGVTRPSLSQLRNRPHPRALEYLWSRRTSRSQQNGN